METPKGPQHPITMAQWLVGFKPPAVGTCGVTMMRHCSKSSLGANISTTYRGRWSWINGIYGRRLCPCHFFWDGFNGATWNKLPLADMNHEILNMPYNALVWPLHILVTGYKNPLFLEQICRVLVTARLNKQQTKIENALRDLAVVKLPNIFMSYSELYCWASQISVGDSLRLVVAWHSRLSHSHHFTSDELDGMQLSQQLH